MNNEFKGVELLIAYTFTHFGKTKIDSCTLVPGELTINYHLLVHSVDMITQDSFDRILIWLDTKLNNEYEDVQDLKILAITPIWNKADELEK